MDQKRALITGSSRGIGRALALGLAKDGFEVLIHYAGNREKAQEVCALIEQSGGSASLLCADLCDPQAAEKMMQQAGQLDVLILNASIQIRRRWLEISPEDYQRQMTCNFYSSMRLIQLAAPAMIQKHWGRIVTIGSVQERKPHPDMLVYSSAKAAQTSMVQSLSLQLAKDGITVNNVAPGVIVTDRNTEALSDPAYASQVQGTIPAGFFGQPEDCAGVVRLLCSEAGRYITGQSIYVDGGKSVQ